MTTIRTPIHGRLQELADATRCRLLAVLEGRELTVGELAQALALPQSTVSRHLRILAGDGWVTSRAEGASRWYTMSPLLDEDSDALWALVRGSLVATATALNDADRVAAVVALRRSRSEEFFATAARQWDDLRTHHFGAGTELVAMLALLDPASVIGDLGCGTGVLSEALAPHVAQVIAIDKSDEMLAAARARTSDFPNVTIANGSLECLPINDASLDIAAMVLVLHHVAQPAIAFREARRVLKPGGRLLVTDMRPHEREEYRQQMGHVWLGFDEATLNSWATDAGFCSIRFTPLPVSLAVAGPPLFSMVAT